MIFHIFCLIKKLCKMRKFAKFTLVISLFKYFRKNFLDRFLNLLREITCLQNVFFDIGFLIYFELFKTFLRYSDISIEPMWGIALSICTSPHYLGQVLPSFNLPSSSTYSNELLIFLIIKNIWFIIIFVIVVLMKSKTAHTKFNSISYKLWVSLPVH